LTVAGFAFVCFIETRVAASMSSYVLIYRFSTNKDVGLYIAHLLQHYRTC